MNQLEPEDTRQSNLIVGKQRRWMATSALFVIFVALLAVSWHFWDNRNESQINRVLSYSPILVMLTATDGEGLGKVADWLRALVISGKSYGALKTARGIKDAYSRSYAMAGIVEALVKAGKTDEARQVAGEALETARRIKDAAPRARAMVSIVEALAKTGQIHEALETSHRIGDEAYRSRAMVCVVEALAKGGKADEALETASRVEDADLRSRAMVIVAEAMIKNREAGKARSALDVAQSAAQQTTKNSEKSARLSAVAIGLARLHHYRLARETADLCVSSSDKLAAYTAIFREYTIMRNPNLETLFEEEKQK